MSERLYLLDTNVLLALLRGNALGRRVEAKYPLKSSKTRALVSVVTHGEMRVLAKRNAWGPPKLEALQTALDSLVAIDINHPRVIEAHVDIDIYSQHASQQLTLAKTSKLLGIRSDLVKNMQMEVMRATA